MDCIESMDELGRQEDAYDVKRRQHKFEKINLGACRVLRDSPSEFVREVGEL